MAGRLASNSGNEQQTDIWGARVSPDGRVLDSVRMIGDAGYQSWPALAKDGGFKMLLTYTANTADYEGRVYNARRIFGMLHPYPGVAEAGTSPAPAATPAVSIVRGILQLAASSPARTTPRILLDALGRKVLDLKPGANDVSRLAPGVYFVGGRRVVVVR